MHVPRTRPRPRLVPYLGPTRTTPTSSPSPNWSWDNFEPCAWARASSHTQVHTLGPEPGLNLGRSSATQRLSCNQFDDLGMMMSCKMQSASKHPLRPLACSSRERMHTRGQCFCNYFWQNPPYFRFKPITTSMQRKPTDYMDRFPFVKNPCKCKHLYHSLKKLEKTNKSCKHMRFKPSNMNGWDDWWKFRDLIDIFSMSRQCLGRSKGARVATI